MWRGDLSPLGREAALKPDNSLHLIDFGTASQSSGDKSPRHNSRARVFKTGHSWLMFYPRPGTIRALLFS
ncbi:hypothetical protein EGM97_04035 [Pseudomonas sp. AF32]|nr:hypothetical protein [Pseudomonas sp. AF32]